MGLHHSIHSLAMEVVESREVGNMSPVGSFDH